ncbi:unnamed protein product [Polarella glacialis]|uniref:Homing endonuclease LAGLIDADG domain-containing protein n=1 Tax=Polarella glacialis TaxID=89957 RepID=A0A813EZV0_POLGL|nr:unnamed protein product [Polarella glacialis]CAE8684382.1 unnamed protein product [Polarella glacialis]
MIPSSQMTSPALALFRRALFGHSCVPASRRGLSAVNSDSPWPMSQVDRLDRRYKRLRGLLGKLRWQPITHFQAFGQDHQLPVCISKSNFEPPSISRVQLEYFAGFFDGDGCVSASTGNSGCDLRITQSSRQAEALLLFCKAFGGSIRIHETSMGMHRPTICWR